jgi:hypothetical protein
MEDTIPCVCGRLWHIERHLENFERRGRIYCRCNVTLANDEDGSMDAHLLEPRERMPEMRRLLGQIGLGRGKSWMPFENACNEVGETKSIECSLESKQGRAHPRRSKILDAKR